MAINIDGQIDQTGLVDGTPIDAADVVTPLDDLIGVFNNLGNGAQDVETVQFDELGSDPTTPATGKWRLYAKAGGLYVVDDAGAVTGPFGAGGGDASVVTFTPGVLSNWESGADPGNVDDALDQLADRVTVVEGGGGGGGAPDNATFITQTPSAGLTAEQALSTLGTGILKNTTGTGVLSIAAGTDLPTVPISNGGTGQTTATAGFDALSPVTTEGDLIVRGASNNERLAIGTEGQVLTVSSGVPAWADAAGGGGGDSAAYQMNEGSNYTVSSTTFVDIDATNLSLTITTDGGDVLVGFYGNVAQTSGALARLYFDLDVDGARFGGDDGMVAIVTTSNDAASDAHRPVSFVALLDNLSAGSHTFKLQWKVELGTAPYTLYAASGTSPLNTHGQFWVKEL